MRSSTGSNRSLSLQHYRDLGSVCHYLRCLQEPNTYITESRCIIPENIIKQGDLLNMKFAAQKSLNKSGRHILTIDKG